jgi:hypothetical protein
LLWIRKVHSACGLVFAAFLIEHLAATAMGWNPFLFGRYMQFVHAVLAEAPAGVGRGAGRLSADEGRSAV